MAHVGLYLLRRIAFYAHHSSIMALSSAGFIFLEKKKRKNSVESKKVGQDWNEGRTDWQEKKLLSSVRLCVVCVRCVLLLAGMRCCARRRQRNV